MRLHDAFYFGGNRKKVQKKLKSTNSALPGRRETPTEEERRISLVTRRKEEKVMKRNRRRSEKGRNVRKRQTRLAQNRSREEAKKRLATKTRMETKMATKAARMTARMRKMAGRSGWSCLTPWTTTGRDTWLGTSRQVSNIPQLPLRDPYTSWVVSFSTMFPHTGNSTQGQS